MSTQVSELNVSTTSENEATQSREILRELTEFSQFHKIKRQFSLIKEFKNDAKQAIFEVRLMLGDESFIAEGRSIKGAQRLAAFLALDNTKLPKPPSREEVKNDNSVDAVNKEKKASSNHNDNRSHYDPANSRYFEKRLCEINPTEQQLEDIKFLLSEIERALKEVSDNMTIKAKESGEEIPDIPNDNSNNKSKHGPDDEFRMLKGVMRVGNMAKNILLNSDTEVSLVLLCANKPTVTLLHDICSDIQQILTDFCLVADESQACFRVEYKVYQAKVYLSSILFRQENFEEVEKVVETPEPADLLSPNMCLQSLAQVRHAKWFQIKFQQRHNAVKALRLLRDLAIRIPEPWAGIPQYAFELMLEHCATTHSINPPISWIFRKILEMLSSGILYDTSLGIHDPCEKETTNAIAHLSEETRDLMTSEAQYYLRLLAFRRTYDVLGVAKLNDDNENSAAE